MSCESCKSLVQRILLVTLDGPGSASFWLSMVLIAQVQCLEIIPSYDQGSLWPFYMLSLHLMPWTCCFLGVPWSLSIFYSGCFWRIFFPPQVWWIRWPAGPRRIRTSALDFFNDDQRSAAPLDGEIPELLGREDPALQAGLKELEEKYGKIIQETSETG